MESSFWRKQLKCFTKTSIHTFLSFFLFFTLHLILYIFHFLPSVNKKKVVNRYLFYIISFTLLSILLLISGRSKWLSLPVHLSVFLPSANIWSPVCAQSTPHSAGATYNSIFCPPVWHNRLSPSRANDVIC